MKTKICLIPVKQKKFILLTTNEIKAKSWTPVQTTGKCGKQKALFYTQYCRHLNKYCQSQGKNLNNNNNPQDM